MSFTTTTNHYRATRRALAAFGLWCGALALNGCGGGDLILIGAPGVGTGGTGSVAGVLTGLGSVIVDGQRYDDSAAVLERQSDLVQSESLAPSALQVGQYVQLEVGTDGVPTRVRVEGQLAGAVDQVRPAEQRLRVWGQPVEVNDDPARGPVTVFSGYAGLAGIAVQDPVLVYGVLLPDPAAAGRDLLRATRIERLSAAGAVPARITATLRAGGPTGWLLGGVPLDLGRATTLPAGQPVQAGRVVTAVGAWQTGLGAGSAAWAPVALRQWGTAADTGTQTRRLSGAVQWQGSDQMVLQGVRVDVSAGALAAARASLRDGDYITVTGVPDESTGLLVANTIDALPAAGRPAEVRGLVASWAGVRSFQVRGMAVDASSATWQGGGASDMANGRYVEVTGVPTATGLRATQVLLRTDPPEQAVLDLSGQVMVVDAAARRMTLQTEAGQALSVALPAGQALPAAGATVRVEGHWRNGALVASTLVDRTPLDRALLQLEGVPADLVDTQGAGEVLLNGLRVAVDAAQLQALQALRGQRLELGVREVDGRYRLVELRGPGR